MTWTGRSPGDPPVFLAQMRELLKRHPNNSIIWAHTGLGRVVRPVEHHLAMIESLLSDPALNRVCVDISWDEVAKYVISSPEATRRTAELINRHPDRFLFGSDTVAPASAQAYFAVYDLYQPLWDLLSPQVRDKVCKGNYERIFDEGRRRVRAWEKAQLAKQK